jgi:hypothetical protein
VIVSGELCVREDVVMTPSPQSMAVDVNAMMQNGHFGNSASRSQDTMPIFGRTAVCRSGQ